MSSSQSLPHKFSLSLFRSLSLSLSIRLLVIREDLQRMEQLAPQRRVQLKVQCAVSANQRYDRQGLATQRLSDEFLGLGALHYGGVEVVADLRVVG